MGEEEKVIYKITARVEYWDDDLGEWMIADSAEGRYIFLGHESAMGTAEFIFDTLNTDERESREEIAAAMYADGPMDALEKGDLVYNEHSFDRLDDILFWLDEVGMDALYDRPQPTAALAERYWAEVKEKGTVKP